MKSRASFLLATALASLAVNLHAAEPAPATTAEVTKSLRFTNEEIRVILRNIADTYDLNIVIPEIIEGRASMNLRDVTWRQAFDVLLSPIGYRYREDGSILHIESLTPREATNEDFSLPPEVLKMFGTGFADAINGMWRDKDYADALAEFQWNYYNALVRHGFSKDEAMLLLLSNGARAKIDTSL